jgi:7-carboxy-7-deazaguanine synthase
MEALMNYQEALSKEYLRIAEIFCSIDGEVNGWSQGALTIFIRLNGCNLNCSYCDTPLAKGPGYSSSLPSEILTYIQSRWPNLKKVTITGGEPLLQDDRLYALCIVLKHWGYLITIETNGSFPIRKKYQDLVYSWIVDYKLPSSGVNPIRMVHFAFSGLTRYDFVKFVIKDRNDFDEAIKIAKDLAKIGTAKFAFAPVWGALDPGILMNWLLESDLESPIMNIQIHKILGFS